VRIGQSPTFMWGVAPLRTNAQVTGVYAPPPKARGDPFVRAEQSVILDTTFIWYTGQPVPMSDFRL
jgi:hypothetical protein